MSKISEAQIGAAYVRDLHNQLQQRMRKMNREIKETFKRWEECPPNAFMDFSDIVGDREFTKAKRSLEAALSQLDLYK